MVSSYRELRETCGITSARLENRVRQSDTGGGSVRKNDAWLEKKMSQSRMLTDGVQSSDVLRGMRRSQATGRAGLPFLNAAQ